MGSILSGIASVMGGNSNSNGNTSSSGFGNSSNQSQNTGVQGSNATSSQTSANAGGSNNQAYGAISSAMTPTLGYTATAGNLLGSLLGIPQSNFNYNTPSPSPLPAMPMPTASTSSSGPNVVDTLLKKFLASSAANIPAPATTPSTPAPGSGATPPTGNTPWSGMTHLGSRLLLDQMATPTGGSVSGLPGSSPTGSVSVGNDVTAMRSPNNPTVLPTPSLPTGTGTDASDGFASWLAGQGKTEAGSHSATLAPYGYTARANGGPVAAGQPYVVGEHQPEVFVPNQSGTIVPSAPGKGPDGRIPPPGSPPLVGSMFGGHRPPPVPLPGGNGAGGGINPTPPPVTTPPIVAPPVATPPPPAWAPPPAPAASPLDQFFGSAGGKFLLDQGQNAINSNASYAGTLQSGATGQALAKFGQNLGSTYMNDYINHILDYAKLGLGGASAMSGAGGQSQNVGTSTGGSNSGSFGYNQGTSSGTSTTGNSSNGSTDSSSKQGLGI